MRKWTVLLVIASLHILAVNAQHRRLKALKDTSANSLDSLLVQDSRENVADNIPLISLDENDLSDGSAQNVSSVTTAGRDPFYRIASYNFSPLRFKIRGYDADNFSTYINGVQMENVENGFTPYGLWGGLNDVMRNREVSVGLRANHFAFGEIGSTTNIDARASKQRKQTNIGYTFSNGGTTHKWSLTHSTGFNKQGWAFTFSGSRRWSKDGYVEGTYIDSWSYFVGIDKKLGKNQLLSFVAFGSPTETGKSSATTKEAMTLTDNKYYNPYWGYQQGKKRNARIGKTNQPVLILTHDFKINKTTSLVTAANYTFGERGATNIDFYNAPDPRPDYYAYMPSYDTVVSLQNLIAQKWRTDVNTRQINWAHFYDVNRNSTDSVAGVAGHRSHYILGESVTKTQKLNFNVTLNTKLDDNISLSGGASYQSSTNNYFKKVTDLLGGKYFVDLNQFAEFSYPPATNPLANQNDVNHPNRIVRQGDRYGYDYDINVRKATGWAQIQAKYKQWDVFAAAEGSNTKFWRVGKMKNGLFQDNSYGKSSVNNFNNYALKAGFTYNIDSRNHFYLNESFTNKAPNFENVYISPRTRDTKQDNVTNENIQSIEGGYILNSPKVKLRASAYYTEIDNQMNIVSYYDDSYKNFANIAITNINKIHYGTEFGIEYKLLPTVTVEGAASIGRYLYNSRQFEVLTVDNDNSILNSNGVGDTVYSKDYRLGGSPQEAYSLGFTYRSPKFWFVSLSGNYFDQMWLDISPVRRTYNAVVNSPYKSDSWNKILAQEEFKAQPTVDLIAGYSWKLPKSFGLKKRTFVAFNAGVNNLLDNRSIITGGYEQLRFDYRNSNQDTYPPKYFYAYGRTYHISINVRF